MSPVYLYRRPRMVICVTITGCVWFDGYSAGYYRAFLYYILLFIVKLAEIRPIDVVRKLSIQHRTAVKVLQQLCEKGKLRPIIRGKSGRATRYEWVRSLEDEAIW